MELAAAKAHAAAKAKAAAKGGSSNDVTTKTTKTKPTTTTAPSGGDDGGSDGNDTNNNDSYEMTEDEIAAYEAEQLIRQEKRRIADELWEYERTNAVFVDWTDVRNKSIKRDSINFK